MPDFKGQGASRTEVAAFVGMILSIVFFLTYVAWAIIPDHVLISFGVSYFPNKYWAVALPLYCIMLGLFTVIGYVALSMYYNPDLSDIRLAEDKFSKSHATSARVALSKYEGSIPTPADIPLEQVCAVLYSKNQQTGQESQRPRKPWSRM